MSARTKARKRALDVLYEADLRQVDALGVLADSRSRAEGADRTLNPYTAQLVEGVVEHRDRIDELLATYSQGWTVARMPAVDRNVLRIGVWELLYAPDVPAPVVISEAVGLVQELAGEDSPAFVNGLLARIHEVTPTISVD